MKWFTREWQNGSLSDVDAASRDEAYAAYVEAVADRLPERVRQFARPTSPHLSVDDGKLDRLEVDASTRTIRLAIVNGDLQVGYGRLSLDFGGATLVQPSPGRLHALFSDPHTEFLRHEIEIVGTNEIEARFLLWPDGEVALRFTDLLVRWEAIAGDRSSARMEVAIDDVAGEGSDT